jgi:hypothetical protein
MGSVGTEEKQAKLHRCIHTGSVGLIVQTVKKYVFTGKLRRISLARRLLYRFIVCHGCSVHQFNSEHFFQLFVCGSGGIIKISSPGIIKIFSPYKQV